MINTFDASLYQLDKRLQFIRDYIDTFYPPKDEVTQALFRSSLSYTAVIISLYSCYENFVDDILSEYINQIADKSTSFSELPTDIKINNLNLSSEFLNAEQRFRNFGLTKEEVINNIYSGKVTNKLLLKHGGNLSFNILSEYLKKIGITELENKIKKSQLYINYYSEKNEIDKKTAEDYLKNESSETVFHILNDLISQRNSIAHSWKNDDKIGFEIIKNEWIAFIKTFCNCLHEIVIKCYVKWLVGNNKLFNPKKFEIYGSSVIGFHDIILNWKQNDLVIVNTKSNLYICKILSAQIHHESKATIKIEGCNLDKNNPEKYNFYFSESCAKPSTKIIETDNISLK